MPDILLTLPSDSQPHQPWPDYLQASWLRCAHQTSREHWHPPHSARGQTLHSLRQRKRDLLTTGEMALEDLYEFMEGRPCALLLTDESGCLLARTGHGETLAELEALGFGLGAFFSEGRIGTNAINLAALAGIPLVVSGTPSSAARLMALVPMRPSLKKAPRPKPSASSSFSVSPWPVRASRQPLSSVSSRAQGRPSMNS